MVISRSPGKGDHSLARNRNYPPTPLLIAQPGCATSRPPSQLRRFPASSQLLIPGLAKPAIACAAGKPRGSTVGDACRSPVKGQEGRHPPPPPPHAPQPPMHPGLCTRVCTREAAQEQVAACLAFLVSLPLPLALAVPGTVEVQRPTLRNHRSCGRNVWEMQDGASVTFLGVRRKRH